MPISPTLRRATAGATLSLAAAGLVLGPLPAHAAHAVDAEPAAAGISVVEQKQLQDKVARGEISAQTFDSLGSVSSAPARTTTTTTAAAASDTPTPTPAARKLPFKHWGQKNGYFCGPAAGQMIAHAYLAARNVSTASRATGAALSQDAMGNSSHMKTAANGKTSWGSGNFVKGLNAWLGADHYQQLNTPTGTQVRSAVLSNIGRKGMPVAADTVEMSGERHYNGHPVNQTLGHWIVFYGYHTNGDVLQIADPSSSIWGDRYGTVPYFEWGTSSFTSQWLRHNGIAW
ncbi:MAG: C39 family peptidase [Propionibacteriales bacterium]|nr:C39 family peptidase [Propionibacteriales bacterium]